MDELSLCVRVGVGVEGFAALALNCNKPPSLFLCARRVRGADLRVAVEVESIEMFRRCLWYWGVLGPLFMSVMSTSVRSGLSTLSSSAPVTVSSSESAAGSSAFSGAGSSPFVDVVSEPDVPSSSDGGVQSELKCDAWSAGRETFGESSARSCSCKSSGVVVVSWDRETFGAAS